MKSNGLVAAGCAWLPCVTHVNNILSASNHLPLVKLVTFAHFSVPKVQPCFSRPSVVVVVRQMTKPGKMHGFLCHSDASTAVCMPGDPRSVVVPRRPDRTLIMDPQTRLLDLKYRRLVEPRKNVSEERSAAAEKRVKAVATLPRVGRRERRVTESKAISAAPTTPATHGDVFQVVVMRVAIHCQGCAGKVKKHISKMEGVTSYSIDLESKRVTVMGHISPVGVLESISKVKKAEFWQSA